MPVAPATMVRTNRSWPGTSTTDSRRPDGSSSGAKPSSIEMPRAFSSRQPVGVDPGQRRHQRRLAVVDVPGGAERQRGQRAASAAAIRGRSAS